MKVRLFAVAVCALVLGIAIGAVAQGKAAPKNHTLTTPADTKWQPMNPANPKGPQISVIWGDAQKGPFGMLLKIPAGGKSGVHMHTNDYYAVAITGQATHTDTDDPAAKGLAAGSYWHQPGGDMHHNSCISKEDCVLYVHSVAAMDYHAEAAPAVPASGKKPGSK